jgi:two-component system OmpR family response regulator
MPHSKMIRPVNGTVTAYHGIPTNRRRADRDAIAAAAAFGDRDRGSVEPCLRPLVSTPHDSLVTAALPQLLLLATSSESGNHIEVEDMGNVLLIEDDDGVARLVTRALQEDGYRVHRVPDGSAGLRAAETRPFDLIILDLMLPDIDGIVVLRKLMEQDRDQRVLVLSAVPEIATRVACLESGAADFVGKPFALAELLARVRARIRMSAPGAASRNVVVGPVHLDLHKQYVEVHGQHFSLSYREFALLRHLMRRAGQPCTRRELWEDVWDVDFDPRSNVLDVYMRRIRGKLDDPGRIETVRHIGYRFVAG